MAYKSTEEMVRRVRPLLDRLAGESIDRARLLQYLAARAGVVWGALELVTEVETEPQPGTTSRVFIFRDRISRVEHPIPYPSCLDAAIEPMVRAEYERLAIDRPLTMMAESLFQHFYAAHCASCRWRGKLHDQIHRECRFAGYPINFEPAGETEAGG
ncbi:MAG: hypothetical protein M3464_10015 [Chloroflexota bacterium]|nr:hypothetical protein [Chloroflexota bacterium]